MLSAYFLARLAAAPPEAEPAPAKFEFRDAAMHDGRSGDEPGFHPDKPVEASRAKLVHRKRH